VFKTWNSWLVGQNLEVEILKFKDWCKLLNLHGAIDNTHISISKPNITFVKHYFYHKIGGYLIVA
jgi:hypothetical protein